VLEVKMKKKEKEEETYNDIERAAAITQLPQGKQVEALVKEGLIVEDGNSFKCWICGNPADFQHFKDIPPKCVSTLPYKRWVEAGLRLKRAKAQFGVRESQKLTVFIGSRFLPPFRMAVRATAEGKQVELVGRKACWVRLALEKIKGEIEEIAKATTTKTV